MLLARIGKENMFYLQKAGLFFVNEADMAKLVDAQH